MKLSDLFERVDNIMRVPKTRHVTMYFGCCRGDAQSLEQTGFNPSVIGRKHLPLVSTVDMAKNQAGFRDCDAIVEVTEIPANYLQVDFKVHDSPKDIWEAIERVNSGDEVILKLYKQLGSRSFKYLNKLRKK